MDYTLLFSPNFPIGYWPSPGFFPIPAIQGFSNYELPPTPNVPIMINGMIPIMPLPIECQMCKDLQNEISTMKSEFETSKVASSEILEKSESTIRNLEKQLALSRRELVNHNRLKSDNSLLLQLRLAEHEKKSKIAEMNWRMELLKEFDSKKSDEIEKLEEEKRRMTMELEKANERNQEFVDVLNKAEEMEREINRLREALNTRQEDARVSVDHSNQKLELASDLPDEMPNNKSKNGRKRLHAVSATPNSIKLSKK